jgi:hypothetical protein
MIFRGPVFLVVVLFGSSLSSIRKLDQQQKGRLGKRDSHRKGGGGVKLEKAQSSVNDSVLSGMYLLQCTVLF